MLGNAISRCGHIAIDGGIDAWFETDYNSQKQG